MKADHTQPELSLGNHVWEFLEPEPYASFGRGQWACLKGVKRTQGGAQITEDPISATTLSPGATHTPLAQNAEIHAEIHRASWHHCKGHHLLICR